MELHRAESVTRCQFDSMTEPASKRRAISCGQPALQQAGTLASLLRQTGICSIVAQYMIVTELVKVRRVNQLWQKSFSQPSCWSGTSFTPTQRQLMRSYIRLDCMPWLEHLHLTDGRCAADRIMDGLNHDMLVRPYKQQLSACTDLALQRLHIQGNVDAALLQAMPRLCELHVDGDIAADAIPLSTQLRKLTAWYLCVNQVTAMVRRPLAHLQHCGRLDVEPPLMLQLALAYPQLTALTFAVVKGSAAAIVRALTPLCELKHLTIQIDTRNGSEPCNEDLVVALGDLPRLQHFDVTTFYAPTVGFWHAVPKLHADMTRHQTDPKQQVCIRIHAYTSSAILSDVLWQSSLRASYHCSELAVGFGHASDVAWQAFVSDTDRPSATSKLQSLDHSAFTHALRNQRAISTVNERFVAYCKLHSNITCLHLGAKHRLCDSELKTLLLHLPKLTNLTTACPRPLVIQQALAASGVLAKLQRLVLPFAPAAQANPLYLSQLLQLVNATISLAEVAMAAALGDWHALSLQELRACTQHIRAVHLGIECHEVLGDDGEQLSTAEAKLRLLPNLVSLDDAEYFGD